MNKFEVKSSRIHGHGLFARSPLPARRKIGELAGKLVSQRTGRRKARELQSVKIVEFGDGWALDATTASNCFQYINHSCEPNTYMRLHRHRVEFYALRAIAPAEELTCNYGGTHHDGTLPCRCGSARCRGAL